MTQNIMTQNIIFQEIPQNENWRSIQEIKLGWSKDRKFYIETYDDEKLLLRLSDATMYEAKAREYEVIQKFATLNFLMSKPVSFGLCNSNQNVYMVLTWVDGVDLETALPTCSNEKQYQLGREAGTILRKIHSLPIPKEATSISKYVQKKKNQLHAYISSNIRVENDEAVIQFVQTNLWKIALQPSVYQHGDFHPGNLILTPEGNIGVIDFNRWDINDPYEEFYKLELFGTSVSIPYCIGQIDAYFNDKVPEDFWDILAVYVGHSSLYSIKWAEQFGQKDMENMIAIYFKSMKHYDGFQRKIPKWYKTQ